MSVVTQLYFQIVEENNYMFRPLSGWAIIRLRLEYRRKHIYYNVGIKNGGKRSRFTMFGEVCSYIYAMWNLRWLRLCLSRPVYFPNTHRLLHATVALKAPKAVML
jgi:hypothetical protein